MPIKYDIVNATLEDMNQIIEISNTQLGNRYFSKLMLDNPKHIYKVAKSKDNVVHGFCFSYLTTMKEFCSHYDILGGEFNDSADQVAVFKTIAVKEESKGNKIATSLLSVSEQAIRNKNITNLYRVGWKSNSGTNIDPVFRSMRFDTIQELKNFWYQDSINQGFECPECGVPPCSCSAVIYHKSLQGN